MEVETYENPFWIVKLQSEADARLLASRAVGLRSVLKLWGAGRTIPALHQSVKAYPTDMIKPFLSRDKSFRVEVTTFNRTFSMKDKVDKIEMFDYLPVEGPVNLKNPDHVLHYVEDYGLDPNNAPETPYYCYFGLWVSHEWVGIYLLTYHFVHILDSALA